MGMVLQELFCPAKNHRNFKDMNSERRNFVKAYKKSLVQLQKNLFSWLRQRLIKQTESQKKDPWIDFLDQIDRYAVDTGIPDLSYQHDHYLYGISKKSSKLI